ncbi:hypothetical protein AB0940_19130 [Streptomyces sp. NPDC006656]|uniref:hypothetical protein n=1 Tax=Streptomyces sp. NPDC006656 TaxID=3156899 RepID=UPI00345345AB
MRELDSLRSSPDGHSGPTRVLVTFWTLFAVLVTGCAAEGRKEALQGFQLELPPCQTENLTFSGQTSAPGVKLAMSFTAPTTCVEQYLKDHHVDLTTPIYWPASAWDTAGGERISPTAPPFKPETMKQFKLKLDPNKRYKRYIGFRTPKDAEFSVLLDPDGDQTSLYMESRLPGRVGKSS